MPAGGWVPSGLPDASGLPKTTRQTTDKNTVVGLRDSSAETLVGNGSSMQARAEWQLTTVDDLTDAEDLLDSLEAHGYHNRELVVLGNSCFAVRWR